MLLSMLLQAFVNFDDLDAENDDDEINDDDGDEADDQGRHLGEGGLGAVAPPKKKEKRKKKKKEKKEKKKRERKKGTMNSVKLLHIKCCFFPIFQ